MADFGLVMVWLISHALGWPFTNRIFTPRMASGGKMAPQAKKWPFAYFLPKNVLTLFKIL